MSRGGSPFVNAIPISSDGSDLIGQKVMSASLPVVISSDHNSIDTVSVIVGEDPDGYFINASVDNQGRLIIAPTGASATVSGFSFGDVVFSAVGMTSIRRTAYAEQSVDFTGSIISANANDFSAGTGARTIKITYYTSAVAGPLIENVILNGTTAVNLVNSNHCFIEKIEVLTVGSLGSNAGIISLFSGSNGSGTVIGTIAATDNQTFWCHHYVPTDSVCFITSCSFGSSATATGQGSTFVIKSIPIPIANMVEGQISDFLTLYGQSSVITRNWGTPIEVVGPARITMHTTTLSGATITYRSAFDFYEE